MLLHLKRVKPLSIHPIMSKNSIPQDSVNSFTTDRGSKWLTFFTVLHLYRVQVTAVIVSLNFLFSFFPLIMNWTNDTTAASITATINTLPFQFSIVVGITAVVQGFVETTLDVTEAVARSRRHNEYLNRFIPRYLILFALSFPNIVILAIGIPYQNTRIVLILFQSQYNIALMSVIINVWMIGEPLMRTNYLLLLGVSSSLRNTLGCNQPFSKSNNSLIFYIRVILLVVMTLCVIIICRRWFNRLKNKSFMKWSGNEINITGYLTTFSFVFVSIIVASYSFSPDVYSLPNMVYSQYHMAFCTIMFSTLQGRINRHKTQVIEVINNNCPCCHPSIHLKSRNHPLECTGDETKSRSLCVS